MPLVAARSKETLDALILRVHGKQPRDGLRALREAALAANPRLDPARPLPEGTIVALPAPGAASYAAGIPDDVARTIVTALRGYRADLSGKADAALRELDATAALMASDDFKRTVGEDNEIVLGAARHVRDEREEVVAAQRFVKEALDRLEEDLDKLAAPGPRRASGQRR